MAKSGVNMPAGFGGLMRYSEEYKSKFILTPKHVIAYIIVVVLFVTALRIFF